MHVEDRRPEPGASATRCRCRPEASCGFLSARRLQADKVEEAHLAPFSPLALADAAHSEAEARHLSLSFMCGKSA